jgi:hypothetical protein
MTFRVCCVMPNGHESKGASLREALRPEYERHCEDQAVRYPGSRWWIEDCGEGLRYDLIRASSNG